MKIIFIVIDGLGDKPIPELGNKTPLEAAETLNLDFLVGQGICGLVNPWMAKGKLPTSEDAHLALFGYNPKTSNPGRGVLEVLGIGEKISENDVCLRGNFATIDKDFKIIDRRAGRIENTEQLIKAVNRIKIKGVYPVKSPTNRGARPEGEQFNRVKFIIKKAFGHRVGIIIKGKNLSSNITSNDPKKTGVRPLQILAKDRSKEAEFTAKILNEFLEKAEQVLKKQGLNKKRKQQGKLPANYILVRGAGKLKKIKSFREKYNLRTACIAGGTLYKGIGKYLGMDLIKVKGANGLPTTDIRGKFIAARNALYPPKTPPFLKKGGMARVNHYDFVFCHLKATDNLAEDGDYLGKKEFIEKIDKNLKSILNLKNTLLVITADHSTCCSLKRHCKNPVPILVFGNKIKADRVNKFSEKSCKKGGLGKINQLNLMSVILKMR